MKKIEAIIKPFKFEDVKSALLSAGFPGMTVSEVKGCGRELGRSEHYTETSIALDLVPKIKIEIVVSDAQAEAVVSAIQKSAHTGRIGDGKIFVHDLQQVMRIRTGDLNEDAI